MGSLFRSLSGLADHRLIPSPGGVLTARDEVLVGAIGVSGGTGFSVWRLDPRQRGLSFLVPSYFPSANSHSIHGFGIARPCSFGIKTL